MSDEEPTIVIQYSGWMRVEAKDLRFQYQGSDVAKDGCITGTQYLALSDDDQGDYIPENIWDGMRDSVDSELVDVQVITNE